MIRRPCSGGRDVFERVHAGHVSLLTPWDVGYPSGL